MQESQIFPLTITVGIFDSYFPDSTHPIGRHKPKGFSVKQCLASIDEKSVCRLKGCCPDIFYRKEQNTIIINTKILPVNGKNELIIHERYDDKNRLHHNVTLTGRVRGKWVLCLFENGKKNYVDILWEGEKNKDQQKYGKANVIFFEIIEASNKEDALMQIYLSESMKKFLTDYPGVVHACINDGSLCLICGECENSPSHTHKRDEISEEQWKKYIKTVLKWGGQDYGMYKLEAYPFFSK